MDDPFAAPASSISGVAGTSSLGLGVPRGHKPTLSVLLRDSQLPEDDDDAADVELPSVQPLSHELFVGDDFDTSSFLLGRRHVALEEMRSELRAYLTTLRASLVEVINTEYEAFIGLSLGLRHASVSNSLATIRRPVVSIRSEVVRVKAQLEAMRDEIAGVLSERKDVRDVKATLRRLLEMEEVVEKVESLLKLGEGNGKEREVDPHVDSPAKRLERIAGEYNHMLYLIDKAGELPFVQSLTPRLKRIASTLQLDLSELLTETLRPAKSGGSSAQGPSRDAILALLRTYSSLNAIPIAEDIIREAVVRPRLAALINRDNFGKQAASDETAAQSSGSGANTTDASQVESPRSAVVGVNGDERHTPSFYSFEPIENKDGTDSPLAKLYNDILAFVSSECGLLLDVGERSLAAVQPVTSVNSSGVLKESAELATKPSARPNGQNNKQGYHILANVVWHEIATKLMNELGQIIFAAGRPSIFHENYVLTMAFVQRFEEWCPTMAHLQYLRSHATNVTFIKRFQLPVYYQLRFKEIATAVERALDVGSASGGGDVFVMSESDAVWRGIKACWSDDVWLEELAGRFWRLTLQLLSRYRTWINDAVPKYIPPPSASNANLSASNSAPARSSFDGARPSSGSRPGTPSLGGAEDVTEESTLRQLTVLIADARLMERNVASLYDERIAPRLAGHDDENPAESAKAVLQESLRQLTAIVPSLSSQIITILVRRCADHLKHVRSVASQVRASTRKGPAEPSYFVANILRELRAYLGGPGRVVEVELKTAWATAVADDVANRYATILSTQKKTEDSYRWYKKGRQGLSFFGRGNSNSTTTDDNNGSSSEEDKVKLQMQLDVATLAQDAASLGVDVETSEAFRALVGATSDAPSSSSPATLLTGAGEVKKG